MGGATSVPIIFFSNKQLVSRSEDSFPSYIIYP